MSRTCEEYPAVDVRNIVSGRPLGPGVWVDVAGEGLLIYHDGAETWVELTYSDQYLGGRRSWFLCPQCDRRCAILYRRHGDLACRECHDLAYESQRLSRSDRLTLRAQRIRHRLGGSGNLSKPFPERPRGMHRRTYARWSEKGLAAEQAALGAMHVWLDRMKARHDPASSAHRF